MTIEDRARRAAAALAAVAPTDPPPIERRRARRSRRRAAALLTAVAIGGGVALPGLISRDDPGKNLVAGPAPTTSPSTSASTSTTAGAAPPAAARPARFVAVRENGDLVFVEEGGDREVRLANFGDPRTSTEEGISGFIASVALDQHGERAFFEVCCEPASGLVRSVRLDGTGAAEVNPGGGGYHPAVSPDGRFLAIGIYSGIGILDLSTGNLRRIESDEYTGSALRPAWSPDGRSLAVGHIRAGETGRVFTMSADATSFDAIVDLTPEGRSWGMPAFRNDGSLLVAEQRYQNGAPTGGAAQGVVLDPGTGEVLATFDYEGRVLDQAYDDTGTYLLYVTADGVLRWRGGGGAGQLGAGFRTADW